VFLHYLTILSWDGELIILKDLCLTFKLFCNNFFPLKIVSSPFLTNKNIMKNQISYLYFLYVSNNWMSFYPINTIIWLHVLFKYSKSFYSPFYHLKALNSKLSSFTSWVRLHLYKDFRLIHCDLLLWNGISLVRVLFIVKYERHLNN
jgi:hypothetical protein